jgi:hypothetical protein
MIHHFHIILNKLLRETEATQPIKERERERDEIQNGREQKESEFLSTMISEIT